MAQVAGSYETYSTVMFHIHITKLCYGSSRFRSTLITFSSLIKIFSLGIMYNYIYVTHINIIYMINTFFFDYEVIT